MERWREPHDEWAQETVRFRERGCNALCLPFDTGVPPGSAPLRELAERAGMAALVRPREDAPHDFRLMDGGIPPFEASLAAVRAQPHSTETHPLTCWSAPVRLVDLASVIAHGTKGVVLAAPQAGVLDTGEGVRVRRFLEWVAANGEEVTASLEVQDPIVWLDYRPDLEVEGADSSAMTRVVQPSAPTSEGRTAVTGRRRGQLEPRVFDGFYALLLTCGYNPSVRDLRALDDEALDDTPLAIFPSPGALDLDNYGKLVIYTLRGGHLLTLGAVPQHEPDGTPFRSGFLWPHRSGHIRRLDRQGVVSRLGWGRPTEVSSASGATIPAESMLATFPDAGGEYLRYGTGVDRRERRASPVTVQAQVLLWHRRVPVAYRAQVRDGVSTVVGTVPGAAYATSRYPTLSASERMARRQFAISLVEPVVARVIAPDDPLEVEAIARLSPDGGCLLFVINRLGTQSGRLRLPQPDALNLGQAFRAEVLYGGAESRATAGDGALHITTEAHDAMVVRLW